MNNNGVYILLSIFLWFAIFAYWIIRSKAKGILNEIVGLSKLIFSGLILYVPAFLSINHFNYKQFLVTNIIGLIITIFGFVVCVLAREYLSHNWSGKVTIQEKNTLIQSGPYKIIRHPIYSGVLVMMLGSSVIIGNVFDFVWVLFCLFGLLRKSKQEETLLKNEFGEAYIEYSKQTKMIIPYIL